MRETNTRGHKMCVIRVPLGYSELITNTPRHREMFDALRRVLGDFETIRFRTIRFSLTMIEVTIERTDIPNGQGGMISMTETVGSPFAADRMGLRQGQWLTIMEIVEADAEQPVTKVVLKLENR